MNSEERNLTPAMRDAVGANVVHPALLLFADFPGEAIRLWTGYGTLSFDGHQWQGVGELVSVEPINESTDTAQKGVAVTMGGLPGDAVAELITLGDWQNREGAIYLACFDDAGVMIDDPLLLRAGFMDSATFRRAAETCAISITLQSRLSDHLKARAPRYTNETQQRLYSGDKGLEYVERLMETELQWGGQ